MVTMKGTLMLVSGRQVDGKLACPPVSTMLDEHGNKRERWVEFELYELDNGSWLAHRAGMSDVYHRADTRCSTRTGRQSGDPATVADLPDDAVPCQRCKPPYPQSLRDDESVRFEFPRHTWDECPTAVIVQEKLTTIRNRDGSVSTVISDPVDQLLRSAASAHREFAELLGWAA